MPPAAPILPIILAGGMGSRLAPLSSPQCPKPFLPLPDGTSLLSRALRRVDAPEIFLPPMLVGQGAHRFMLLNHSREAGISPGTILLEPQPRNTAMAIACATRAALQEAPDACLAILPADQVIEPVESWRATAQLAAEAAIAQQRLCLLGVTPTRHEPQFGYIEPVPDDGAGASVRTVQHFIEKPEDPSQLPAHCLWNSGQFFVPARVLAELFATLAPLLWQRAGEAVLAREQTWEFSCLGQAAYLDIAPHAFDRLIVERAPVLVAPLAAAWHDLGTPQAWEAYSCQPVAQMLTRPARTDRPWGFYELLDTGPTHCEKRLTLYPGCRLSLQRHQNRAETWRVLEGHARIEVDGQCWHPDRDVSVHIPAESWHRLENIGTEPLIVHEIQMGKPNEADIERREDDYGR